MPMDSTQNRIIPLQTPQIRSSRSGVCVGFARLECQRHCSILVFIFNLRSRCHRKLNRTNAYPIIWCFFFFFFLSSRYFLAFRPYPLAAGSIHCVVNYVVFHPNMNAEANLPEPRLVKRQKVRDERACEYGESASTSYFDIITSEILKHSLPFFSRLPKAEICQNHILVNHIIGLFGIEVS